MSKKEEVISWEKEGPPADGERAGNMVPLRRSPKPESTVTVWTAGPESSGPLRIRQVSSGFNAPRSTLSPRSMAA
ncbi:hypothetical protein C8P63_11620 [Melghirimyces profundicolus]|uniref:Uncharacterized protein n=1 Tax=Melghirimyces profundicolus TaxID=1242148 RepID=A0A2T6BQQ7_9BACL|nr:hypothetical protein [Melghirimyces profundicolus]PTX58433.1 hypothetical protein C8P63_11620 [Melghirimyces profundicolus]